MVIIYILYLLVFVIIGVIGVICIKLKSLGIDVKDFFEFIFAINDLDALYVYSKSGKNMTKNEENAFLKQAEKIFSAFEKVPSIIWEDEYEKYSEVLEKYKDIKVIRWSDANA